MKKGKTLMEVFAQEEERRRSAESPAYAQIPRGRNAKARPIRYERWSQYWDDCLAALEQVIRNWPETRLKNELHDSLVLDSGALSILQAFGAKVQDRALSPAQLAELLLTEFGVANARALGYDPIRGRRNPSRALKAQS